MSLLETRNPGGRAAARIALSHARRAKQHAKMPPVETPPEMVSTFVRYFYRHIREKVDSRARFPNDLIGMHHLRMSTTDTPPVPCSVRPPLAEW